jgi:hypothetical protein
MKRRAISGAVAAIIVAVAVGAGASVYYLGVVLPAGRTIATDTMMSTLSTSSLMPSTKTTDNMMSTVSSSVAASSSSKSSAQSSSSQAAKLHIVALHVSHTLSGATVAATCAPTTPAQGASYLKVTNNGTAPAEIVGISFNYVEMMTESGAPTGTCTVAAGATEYITLRGIGEDPATAGQLFTVSITGNNGGWAYLDGSFV